MASAPHWTQAKPSRWSACARSRRQARVEPRRCGWSGHGSAFGHPGTEQTVNARGIASTVDLLDQLGALALRVPVRVDGAVRGESNDHDQGDHQKRKGEENEPRSVVQ